MSLWKSYIMKIPIKWIVSTSYLNQYLFNLHIFYKKSCVCTHVHMQVRFQKLKYILLLQ